MMQNGAKTLLLLIALSAAVFAQTPTGTLQGTIEDPSRAGIPNATVTITNAGTGETKEVKADSTGHYLQLFLQPGVYSITAQAQGFRPTRQDNVKIDVGLNRTVDVSLQVGANLTEVVNVTALPPALDVNTSSVGNVIQNQEVVDLPLNGRNVFSLAAVNPGVVSSNSGEATPHMGGSRNSVSEVQLDGVSIIAPENNVGINVRVITPPIDSVQEFNIQINTLSAEYGRFAGGVINVVTKSGTNAFHGTGFGFFQNSALNANDFFANASGTPKSDTSYKQYGGSIGGPVLKNKTFFFFDFQRSNNNGPAPYSMTTPVAAWRTGDFSTFSGLIFDPSTGHNCAVSSSCPDGFVRNAFPGNKIPTNEITGVGSKLVAYFPQPNTGGAGAQSNNFYNPGVNAGTVNNFDARGDQSIGDKWRIFMRVSHSWQVNTPPNNFGDPKLIDAEWSNWNGGGPQSTKQWSAALDNTISISPTLILNIRYGYGRQAVNRTPYSDGFDITSLGMPAAFAAVAQTKEFPRLSFSGPGTGGNEQLGNEGWSRFYEMSGVHNLTANITKVLSRHTIKTGFEFRKLLMNFGQYAFPTGNWTVDQTWSQQNPQTGNNTGNAIASLLLGIPSSGQLEFDPTPAAASSYWAGYLQDDFKVSSKLTLNLGLRYDLEVPRTERHNQLSYFDPSLASPLAGKVPANACAQCGSLMGQMVFVGTPGAKYGRSQVPTYKKDFAPRLGLAFNVAPKWVVRAGFGIAYAPSTFQAAGSTGGAGMEGFQANSGWSTSLDNNHTAVQTLANAYFIGGPNPINFPLGPSGGASTDLGYSVQASFFTAVKSTYSEQWNLNVQHELPSNITVEVGYLGNRGVHLPFGNNAINLSQLPISYLSLGSQLTNIVANPFYQIAPGDAGASSTTSYANLLRPFPQYFDGVSTYRKPLGNSLYNGLLMRMNKRFSHGLTLLMAYTFAKTLSDTDSAVGFLGAASGGPLDSYNIRNEWAVDAQNVSSSFVTSAVYDLPFGKGKAFANGGSRILNGVVGGWQLNGIVTIQTGTPIIIGGPTGSYTNGIGAGNRLNSTGQSPAVSNPSISEWFNPNAFTQPANYTLGNLARTLPNVNNPGISTGDLSLFKNFRFGHEGRFNGQFRTEWFNALNKPQFGGPGTSFGSGNFGQITGTAGGDAVRVIQMAAKFIF